MRSSYWLIRLVGEHSVGQRLVFEGFEDWVLTPTGWVRDGTTKVLSKWDMAWLIAERHPEFVEYPDDPAPPPRKRKPIDPFLAMLIAPIAMLVIALLVGIVAVTTPDHPGPNPTRCVPSVVFRDICLKE